ncbi:acanthoscurrin-1 [Maritalea myrionectae]|uniref:Acanthoscurrin-1 n=1 Tax=Maritalea myrionectae TaxID=454601 RepID=A0A2R4MEI4_9HYPH|nr:hypothetical protein [Maritalea myrionectae]AVX04355.1 acanthoscurrin-1 [Maritalea myrionectae]
MTQSVAYVEIDIDYCSLTYGTSPCTAAIGVTGTKKCFNSLKTCQDRANFTNSPVTLRFGTNTDFDALPYLAGFSFQPGRIAPGKSLGVRSSLTVTLSDHPHSDTGDGYDKYISDRGIDPYTQGTHWGKFRPRQPYLRARTLRYIQGVKGQDIADMETRTFTIEGFNGPNRDGKYTITAKDDLKRADGDRALYPALSPGSLIADITSGDTSATLSPSGIGDSDYPASGYVTIGGKEICSFTRSADVLTLTRGQYNTDAIAHSGGDRVQVGKEYLAQDPADVLNDLLVNGAGVDASEIPLSEWQTETTDYYGRVISALIPEPTPVDQLASEIIEQCGLMVWWDDLEPEVRLRVLREIPTDALRFDDTKILQGSLQITEQPNERVSRVETYYGMRNPVESIKNKDNYRASELYIDTEAEENDGKAIRQIHSRWIATGGSAAAERVNKLIIGMYRDAPRKFTFNIYRHSDQEPKMGDGCIISDPMLVTDEGVRVDVPAQILRVSPRRDYYEIEAQEFLFDDIEPLDPNDRPITISSNDSDVNLRTLHDALYPAPTGGEVVTLNVNSGVVIKANAVSTYALNIGSWPELDTTGDITNGSAVVTNIPDTSSLVADMFVSGVGIPDGTKILSVDSGTQVTLDANATSTATTSAIKFHLVRITVNQNGVLTGKGGKGANGRGGDNNPGYDGQDGGDAFYLRYPINLNADSGATIQGGGGGGGGGAGDYIGWFGPQANGGGGGGGAGYGLGGTGAPGAQNGAAGGLDTGGAGGNSNQGQPAGDGGDRAQVGGDASDSPITGGDGGAAGQAVDGWSYVLEGTFSGTYYGAKVN